MPDIEDELLALAGGNESSDEEEEEEMSSDRQADSALPEPANKGKTTSAAKRGSNRTQDDSAEEEGEAYSEPGSPNSIGSAAMDESDSEAEAGGPAADADEDEKYPVDGMFASMAEKAHIMSLREVERESILAERQTEIERQRQNRMLRQLVSKQAENEQKKKAMKIKKRTATSADLDDDDRKSSRQRTETKTGAAIDSLRRARAEKNDRARAREENRRQGRDSPRRRSSSAASFRSRDSYDDRDRSRSREQRSEPRELPPATIRDFERIRVGRSRFAQYCFNPGFEDALIGCFVRVSLGPDASGMDQYRMCKIKSFTSGKAYAMSGPGGSFVTDQYVVAQHGKDSKDFAFIFCSDKPFTEREFNRYMVVIQNDGISMPKTQVLLNKIDDINKFVSRSLTNEEIGEKVERKRALRTKYDPERRERLAIELEEARFAGKTNRVQEIQEELDELQTNRLAFRTSLAPQKSASGNGGQQERLADINRERRRQNATNVAKAQLKEGADARKREQAAERGETAELDMSRRIRTRAKFIHDEFKENADKSATPSQNGTPKLAPQQKKGGEALPHLAKALENAKNNDKKGLPTIHRPIFDDDIIGEIDLELDVEID